jgi:hypothetical protein
MEFCEIGDMAPGWTGIGHRPYRDGGAGSERDMKRYIVFLVIGPFLGGFLILLASTLGAEYWSSTHPHDVTKLLVLFFKSLPYNYLFGFLPVMAFAAIDDIISHIHRVGPVVRMVVIGVVAFFASAWLYSYQAGDPSTSEFILYGFAGLIPAVLSSWISHRLMDPQPAPSRQEHAT